MTVYGDWRARVGTLKGVVFDMDGVLTDTEHLWATAYETVCVHHDVAFTHEHKMAMIGMSTSEWSTYMTTTVGIQLPPASVADAVEMELLSLYDAHLPVIPGAVDAVTRLASSFTIAIASSSTRRLIEHTTKLLGIDGLLAAVVSSEEVARGKPKPDVYLEAVRRIGLEPWQCAAVEDSSSGIRSAHAAGLMTLGFPHVDFPAEPEALLLCAAVLESMNELTVRLVAGLHA
jgi:HAD superfamily hydrolase (TIGR01509 family)